MIVSGVLLLRRRPGRLRPRCPCGPPDPGCRCHRDIRTRPHWRETLAPDRHTAHDTVHVPLAAYRTADTRSRGGRGQSQASRTLAYINMASCGSRSHHSPDTRTCSLNPTPAMSAKMYAEGIPPYLRDESHALSTATTTPTPTLTCSRTRRSSSWGKPSSVYGIQDD